MLPRCPVCGYRYMRRLINPFGYWCPDCNKILTIIKYPKKKIKIRISEKNNVGVVIVSKKKLMEQIKKLK